MTSALAAEASMMPRQYSFQDLILESSPFPVDRGGLPHTNALFCYFVTAHYVRKKEAVQPVNLCHRHSGCGTVLSQMWLSTRPGWQSHHGPCATDHFTSLASTDVSPPVMGVTRLHSRQVQMNYLDPSSKSTKMAVEARVPTGCLLRLHQPGSTWSKHLDSTSNAGAVSKGHG